MKFQSTRGASEQLGFVDAMLTGLAPDGGLYFPTSWPTLPPVDELPQSYASLAEEVMWPFVDGEISRPDFTSMVADSYSTFAAEDVVPLVDLGDDGHLLELFWGPTLAFKDVALQLVGRLFNHVLAERNQRVTIVVATSGDTGSAAIEAARGRDAINVVVLHPADRVSDVQRRQMTTVDLPNVHNVAVEGTFDDCQDLVKAMFADVAFREQVNLSAMNSINWARVMPQAVYYVSAVQRAAVGAGGSVEPVNFSVPTGNFGNVLAGYIAKRMGLAMGTLVVASNRNDILTRFLATGDLAMGEVHPTHSPSMDIQVSSNLERLLFDAHERSGAAVASLQSRFRADGRVEVDPGVMARIRKEFIGCRVDDDLTVAVIRSVHEATGVVIDPHTAVGIGAARQLRAELDGPIVTLATAHPAKFPDVVESAIGERPSLPGHLIDLFERPERMTRQPNDLEALKKLVVERTS